MKGPLAKFIVLTILIFAVLEKSGVSLMPLIWGDQATSYHMVFSDPENTKEAENAKETAVKEVWVSGNGSSMLTPVCKYLFRQPAISRDAPVSSFYPSIPTPPPNL